jgi:ribosomal protein S18 acetylase RimI-like enzyme
MYVMEVRKMSEAFALRRLVRSDAEAYRRIRLEALAQHPEAFSASLEDETAQPRVSYERRILMSEVFGGFQGKELMGIARFSIEPGAKRRHIGVLTGMYVREAARGTGLASALVEHVIAAAKDRVERLNLTVTASNTRALRLYQRHGFRIYATEGNALKVDGRYYDEHLMTRELRTGAG